jgi:hypothetical protein
MVRLKRPAQGAGTNAVWLGIWNLCCLSSDRRHAGTEGAVGPTEMCTLLRPDLGTKGVAYRSAQTLSRMYIEAVQVKAQGKPGVICNVT